MPAAKRKTTKRKTKVAAEQPRGIKITVNSQNASSTLSSRRKKRVSNVEVSQNKKEASGYVLNLKKIMHERELKAHANLTYLEKIKDRVDANIDNVQEKLSHAHEWLNELPQKNKNYQKITYHIPQKNTSVHEIELEVKDLITIKPVEKITLATTLRKIKFPELSFPKIPSKLANFDFKLPGLNLKHLQFSTYAQRATLAFILASFTLTSPLLAFDYYQKLQNQKGQVLGIATEGISHVKTGASVLALDDFDGAKIELSQAFADFLRARKELDALPFIVKAFKDILPQGEALETANYLLDLAMLSSQSATELVEILDNNSTLTLTERLEKINEILSSNKEKISELSKNSAKINLNFLPQEYQTQVQQVLSTIPLINDNADKIIEINDIILNILGNKQTKRYLLLFQNNAEMRANGGFLGSFAVVDINQGQIKNMNIPAGGTYDLKGQLKVNVQPPQPISILNPRWEIQDANYFADYKQSAEKIAWFYRQSGGTTVDGVIAINSSLLTKILKITGPIALESPAITIDESNVTDIIQELVESGTDKDDNKPKRVLAELMPIVLNRLLASDKKSFIETVRVLSQALVEKDILLNFTDPDLQSIAESRRMAGRVVETDGDFLSIVSSNIAGGKSSISLSDKIVSKTEIEADGSIVRTIELTRAHNGGSSSALRDIKNNDYIRFMVPYGSQLLEANGFEPIPANVPTQGAVDSDLAIIASTKTTDAGSGTEIYSEAGKTVFANWIQINSGEQKAVRIKYKLPLKLEKKQYKTYKLLIQPQPGNKNQTFDFVIETPHSYKFVWAYPSQITASSSKQYLAKEIKINTDSILGIVFE